MVQEIHAGLFYSLFFNVRKKILLSFYTLLVVCFGLLAVLLIGKLSGGYGKVSIAVAMIISTASIICGAFISVILELPKVGFLFDQIKNDVALQEIRTVEAFAKRTVDLFCKFFTFYFFTVKHAFIKVTETRPVYSDDSIAEGLDPATLDHIMARSQQTETVFRQGTQVINNKKHYLYIIPIWIGEKWLGYIGILTSVRLLKIFQTFLNDIENLYIDDLIIHVLNQR